MKALATAFLLFVTLQGCLLAQTVTVTISFPGTTALNGGNPIQLLSFKIGAQQATQLNLAGTGASAGKSQFTTLTLYKGIDQTTPELFIACATGKLIKSAMLTVSSTDSGIFFQVALQNVYISTINDDSTNSDGGPPCESFSLSYSKIGWQYTPPDQGAPLAGGFDIIKNVSIPYASLVPGPQ
jgi:type VI secretion system secreted protein Hcp